MPEFVLGISAFYHDSAACLIRDGEIIAAAQEERFTRKKHDDSFPVQAIKYVVQEAGISTRDIAHVSFYDKPFLKFERLLETFHAFVPNGLKSFATAIPVWIKEKLFIKKTIKEELKKIGFEAFNLYFPEHHLSHAASAYFPSPYKDSAILTLDGVGEWTCTGIFHGQNNKIKMLAEQYFPHSLGLLYAAFTYYIGFKVNSGEYKLMGLAPYGIPSSVETKKYVRLIKEHLIDIRPDGSFLLNMRHFNFATGLTMTKDRNWKKIFGISRREPEAAISQSHMNLALAIQMVTEEIVIQLARTAKKLSGSNHLTLAGGVALNSVANGKLLRENIFDNIWIQPAATDSGGSLGAALAAWHIYFNQNRSVTVQDNMKGAYLGPDYTSEEIEKMLINRNASFQRINEEEKLFDMTAKELESGKVVGWFQGRMEYGPRALGNRSILADARNPEMQKKLNLKIKKREGFRPFAPSVLEEDIKEFFEIRTSSPYMLHVVPVQEKHRKDLPTNYENLDLYEKLYIERSDIPAVTHIDFSARLQSVNKKTNPRFWSLLKAFKKLTGVGILINTSFNVRGEPIVCTPEDAFNCFMNTDMDVLVLSKYILRKEDQSEANNINMKFEAD